MSNGVGNPPQAEYDEDAQHRELGERERVLRLPGDLRPAHVETNEHDTDEQGDCQDGEMVTNQPEEAPGQAREVLEEELPEEEEAEEEAMLATPQLDIPSMPPHMQTIMEPGAAADGS